MRQSRSDVQLGRFLCLILRHHPEEAGITLDEHGWADVGALLVGVCNTGRWIDRETLERIVREDNKQRYTFNEDHSMIRANQGHSIQVDVELRKMQPPQYLYHGTAARFLPGIQAEGIKRMGRQYVHLSPDYQTAVAVGRRHGSPVVVLRIEAGAMAQNGDSILPVEERRLAVRLCVAGVFLHSGGRVKRGRKLRHKCPSGHLTFSKEIGRIFENMLDK